MRRWIALFLAVLICGLGFWLTKSKTEELPRYIMHGGGVTPNGKVRTSSAEAMTRSYEQGHYWLEIDFNWTSDGHLACVHDWDSYYSVNLTGVPSPDLALYETLRKDTYGYENHTLESLIAWMEEHPKAIIVTDVKANNLEATRLISRYPKFQNRFVIQIYDASEYEPVVSLGFDRIIFTFYNVPPGQEAQSQLKKVSTEMENVIAVALSAYEENAALAPLARELGIPFYVHTVNDVQEQQQWLEAGACGIYCDTVPE